MSITWICFVSVWLPFGCNAVSGISSHSDAFHPDIFYDNKVLPENLEVTTFIFREEIKRLFYLAESDDLPLSLSVTPCMHPIQWRLMLRDFPIKGRRRGNSFRSPILLMSYSGLERRTYSQSHKSLGLYVLELFSGLQDTFVTLLVTVCGGKDCSYPLLPLTPQIEVLQVDRNKLLISWKPIPVKPGESIAYCVAVNPRTNYYSLCTLKADTERDLPLQPPPSSGFGFEWEQASKKKLKMRIKQLRRMSKMYDDVRMECVGKKTWHEFRDLAEGRIYYLDVFAVNSVTNLSSAYSGTKAVTLRTPATAKLRENTLTVVDLAHSNNFSATLEYSLLPPTHVLWFFLQSCSGPGPIEVTIEASTKLLSTLTVMDLKSVALVEPPNGTLVVTLTTNFRISRQATVWVSRKYQKYPFPMLPENKRIQVFDTLATCDSVTVSWRAALDDKLRYCVYRRSALKSNQQLDRDRHYSLCEEPADGSTRQEGRVKLICRRYQRFSRNRFKDVIVQQVRGLQPDSTYVVEVHVTKFRGKTLPYEEVWVTTRGRCE